MMQIKRSVISMNSFPGFISTSKVNNYHLLFTQGSSCFIIAFVVVSLQRQSLFNQSMLKSFNIPFFLSC